MCFLNVETIIYKEEATWYQHSEAHKMCTSSLWRLGHHSAVLGVLSERWSTTRQTFNRSRLRHFSSHRESAVCWEPTVGHNSVGDSRGWGRWGGRPWLPWTQWWLGASGCLIEWRKWGCLMGVFWDLQKNVWTASLPTRLHGTMYKM